LLGDSATAGVGDRADDSWRGWARLLAVSMAGAPVLAQSAPSAAPLSVSARSGADTSDANQWRGGFIIPVIAVVAIILGILAATGGHGDRPHSP